MVFRQRSLELRKQAVSLPKGPGSQLGQAAKEAHVYQVNWDHWCKSGVTSTELLRLSLRLEKSLN